METETPLTQEDYMRACDDLSRCSSRTLPYVLQLLRKVGFVLEDVPELACRVKSPDQRRAERMEGLMEAFGIVAEENIATIADLSRQLGYTTKTIRNQLAEAGCFTVRNGLAILDK